jgi:hypothetical protein
MDITVAYFHPLFHSEMVKRDFEQIRAAGASNIVYALHEQEEQRWPRDIERGVRLAHESGLRFHISLGRFGNLFAGPSLMPSWYTFRHPQSQVKDRHGRSHDMTCFNHEDFRSWLFKEVEYYLSSYPIQGVLIDEPLMPDITCFCSVCRALCPDITDLQHFRHRSMVNFFSELFSCVKRVSRHIKTSLVMLPQDMEQIEDLASIPTLDTIGCDLFWQLLGEDVAVLDQWSRTLVEATRQAGKRSQLWLQNFNLDEQGEKSLEPAFASLLNSDPDEIACYYFWRNNADPERVWEQTRTLLRRIPRRQLHWRQPTFPRIPAVPHPSEEKA